MMWIVGLILIAAGALWTLQGRGIIGGSFMSNNRTWLRIGIGCIIVGAAVIAWAILLP
jgi:hypothetical protein